MKFTLSREHYLFFKDHGYIEFEGLLSTAKLTQLKSYLYAALAEKMGCDTVTIKEHSSQTLFQFGHDLWRASPSLKKLLMTTRLAEIAATLINQKTLRLGYDQLLISPVTQYATPFSLKTCSYLQGALSGTLLCLEGATAGNAIFFSKDTPFDFSRLPPHQTYLFILYTHPNSVYIKNDKDPHMNHLKEVGYTFGDRLSDKLNPLIRL